MNKTPKNVKTATQRLRLLFLSLALVMVVSVVLTFLVGHTVLIARSNVQARDAALEQLQDAFSLVQDAETGQRGYLLTKERKYLQPYHDARSDLRKSLESLRDLADRGELPSDEVAAFVSLITQKLAELQQTLDLLETGGSAAAVEMVREGSGKQLMDGIREKYAQLQAQQQRARGLAEDEAVRATYYRTGMFVAMTIVNLAFLGWIFLRLRREMALQYVANLEIERQREILAVTLASIGDAVMITDTSGIITFLNKVAEDLTGWSSEEAVGKPCGEVFRIINETSRAQVHSPVDKVLESGVIVGLANHTLLIRRDESEVPIDDSGAPIREKDGAIRGVVLVFRDFTSHKQIERHLIQAKEDVEAASKAKDHFLATLSHELRTPLTPVLATLSAWEANRSLPAVLHPELELVRRNVEMEARLIDDLLDLTRIEHGKLSLETEPVNVHGLIDAVVALYAVECEAKNIQLAPSLQAVNSHVIADPARLQQVFWNIVGNAVKFTPNGGYIQISTTNPSEDELEITIKDDGIGMDTATMERLFHRFEQGSSIPQKAGGLGLGLSIAKALVGAHHGTLRAASKGPNEGSSFTITLPTTNATHPNSTMTGGTSIGDGEKNLKILLVEDHADTAQVMGTVLRGMGHTVEIKGTVAAGLEQIRRQKFDLILSDLGLPDGTGIDFIQAVRKECRTPAIALTGYGMAEDIEKCLRAGFNEHLTKPIDFERLQKSVQAMTKNHPSAV